MTTDQTLLAAEKLAALADMIRVLAEAVISADSFCDSYCHCASSAVKTQTRQKLAAAMALIEPQP
jgi:hypothetical protein